MPRVAVTWCDTHQRERVRRNAGKASLGYRCPDCEVEYRRKLRHAQGARPNEFLNLAERRERERARLRVNDQWKTVRRRFERFALLTPEARAEALRQERGGLLDGVVPEPSVLAGLLTAERVRRGMTMDAVAAVVGVAPSTVSRAECGYKVSDLSSRRLLVWIG